MLPLWIVLLLPVMVLASSESSRSASAGVFIFLLVLLVYIEIRARSVFCLQPGLRFNLQAQTDTSEGRKADNVKPFVEKSAEGFHII